MIHRNASTPMTMSDIRKRSRAPKEPSANPADIRASHLHIQDKVWAQLMST